MQIRNFSVLFMFAISGCAAPGYKPIPAEALNPTSQSPKDIGSDALEISKFHAFDDNTFVLLDKAVVPGQEDKVTANAIREVLCNGQVPKIKDPELFVTLIIPKGNPQDSVETISRHNQEFIKLARIYLRRWLIMDASDPKILGQSFNPDFANFKENILDTDYERKLSSNQISVLIPFLHNNDEKSVTQYYLGLRETPALPQLQLEPQFWFPSRNFMAIASQRDRKIILSIKAADFIKTAYGYLNYGVESDTEIIKKFQLKTNTYIQHITDSESYTIRNHTLYSFSPQEWKLDQTTARPLRMTVIEDIGLLRLLFAWRLPKEIVEGPLQTKVAVDQRRLGLNDGKFSPDLAIAHAQDAWREVMLNYTEVSESANDDGTIRFQLKANFLKPFCQHAISIPDLKGQ